MGADRDNYRKGIFFLIILMLISCANDVISKFMGTRLNAIEIIFFRFFFGLITLLPFIISRGSEVFRTKQPYTNIIRGVLGAISLFLCTYAVITLPLVEVTVILWTIPLFHLILAKIFLGENVSSPRWIVTAIGFVGLSSIVLIGSDYSVNSPSSACNKLLYLVPICAALLFAVQDVMIKKIVTQESRATMLLYFAITSSAVSFIPALCVWETPTVFEFCMLFLLGIGGNLIQYFIFKAFNATDLSALAPFRYIEFLFSALFAFIFFAEIPGINVILGALILIPSTLYLGYSEKKKCARSNKT